jgi:hypothetical protein
MSGQAFPKERLKRTLIGSKTGKGKLSRDLISKQHPGIKGETCSLFIPDLSTFPGSHFPSISLKKNIKTVKDEQKITQVFLPGAPVIALFLRR